jgi:hypothetical protein
LGIRYIHVSVANCLGPSMAVEASLIRTLRDEAIKYHTVVTCKCTCTVEPLYYGYRDMHIMLFKVPIMLCSNSQHQANYVHCTVPVMPCSQFLTFHISICDNSFGNLQFILILFQLHVLTFCAKKDKLQPY